MSETAPLYLSGYRGIEELEKKAEHADDPQVREWAAKTLPKMRQHLAKAKAVQETLERKG